MLNIAICDDDRILCAQLEKFLLCTGQDQNELLDVDIFYRGEMLFRALDNGEKYDIIFLDIELVSMSGIKIGQDIRENREDNKTQIIYISGHSSYALALFKTRPFDFLLKPLKYEDVKTALCAAIQLLRLENQYFEFSAHRRMFRVPISDIIYFESIGKKVQIVTTTEIHEFYSRMVDVAKQLISDDFLEIHNSYLIHYRHVEESAYDFVIMINKAKLPISRNHRKNVRAWLLRRKGRNRYD